MDRPWTHLRAALVLVAAYAMATLPLEVGLPGEDVLFLLQRPLRIRQGWGLYGAGPDHAYRLEVWVDDGLVYRSQDPDHTWRFPLFNHRRTKPITVSYCHGEKGRNERAWRSYVLRAVLEDFPEAQSVELLCTRSPWPGDQPQRFQSAVTSAPRWRWRSR